MDAMLVLKPLNFFLLRFVFLSPQDEKDENDKMRQMQGNTVVMHICADEKSECVCVFATHERSSECVYIYVSLSLF